MSRTGSSRPPPPPIPEPAANASALERQQLHTRWIKERLNWAQDNGATIQEIASLSTQYTNANRLMAKLNGELDITAPQIIRSTAWKTVMDALRKAFFNDPEALQRVIDAIDEIEGVKRVDGT